MPMINGRYYMNPAMGAAIEEARSLLERKLPNSGDDGAGDESNRGERSPSRRNTSSARRQAVRNNDGSQDQRGVIQRIEIEVAEAGPKHPGLKTHGYVAHVHRSVAEEPQGAVDGPDGFASGHFTSNDPASNDSASNDFAPGSSVENSDANAARGQGRPGALPGGVIAPRSTAHVFTNTGDLVNFLRDALDE